MSDRPTMPERLARIETLLEDIVAEQLKSMADDIKAIRTDLDKDKADLAQLKNRGWGLLAGVALAAGGAGAFIRDWLS